MLRDKSNFVILEAIEAFSHRGRQVWEKKGDETMQEERKKIVKYVAPL